MARCVIYTPDGERLVSGGRHGQIKLWDVVTGQQILELNEHTGEVHSLEFYKNGAFLVSGSKDGSTKIWEGGTVD